MICCILVDDDDDRLHEHTIYLPVSMDYIGFVRLRPINLIVSERERKKGGEGEGRVGGRERG